MPKLPDEVRERLLEAGVAPRHVRRYLNELSDHWKDLTAEEERAGRNRADARSAALARLGGVEELSRAMMERPEFQSWSARAPWAVFGVSPLLFLAGAWCIALLLLWSGWRMFLRGEETPFVPIHGMAILYFGLGRSIFLGAPVLAGWAIGLMAARQRLRVAWPVAGLVLLALIGGSAKVHADQIAGGGRHISLGFTLAPSVQGSPYGLLHLLLILVVTLAPYLGWRLLKGREIFAEL